MGLVKTAGQSLIDKLVVMLEEDEVRAYNIQLCPTCQNTGFEWVERCQPSGKWYKGVVKVTHCCNYWTNRLTHDVGQGRKQL